MTWEQICADPILAELPYKIESDEWGNILMSPPPGSDHSDYQGEIMHWFFRLKLSGGRAQPEFPLQTRKGVKGIDVVWISNERRRQKPARSIVHLIAPEICIEILSPTNKRAEIQQKMLLYFGRGAQECWICDRKGNMTFFDPSGPIQHSELCPRFPRKIVKDWSPN